MSTLTGSDTYFEDYFVGQKLRHARGTTISEVENQLLTKLVLNTADGHFNEARMQQSPAGQRVVFGFVTASMVIGLATQDTAENAVREIAMDKLKFLKPVFHGDTVQAFTEVLSKERHPDQAAGKVLFKHWGTNQDGDVVFEGERAVLIKCRPQLRMGLALNGETP